MEFYQKHLIRSRQDRSDCEGKKIINRAKWTFASFTSLERRGWRSLWSLVSLSIFYPWLASNRSIRLKHIITDRVHEQRNKKRTTINSWALEYINYTRRTFNKPNPPKQKQIIIGNLFLLIWHTHTYAGNLTRCSVCKSQKQTQNSNNNNKKDDEQQSNANLEPKIYY